MGAWRPVSSPAMNELTSDTRSVSAHASALPEAILATWLPVKRSYALLHARTGARRGGGRASSEATVRQQRGNSAAGDRPTSSAVSYVCHAPGARQCSYGVGTAEGGFQGSTLLRGGRVGPNG